MASSAKRLKLNNGNALDIRPTNFKINIKRSDIRQKRQEDAIAPGKSQSVAGPSSGNFILHESGDQDVEDDFEATQSALTSTVFVSALETLRFLRKKCVDIGLKGNFCYQEAEATDEVIFTPEIAKLHGQYVVERILDYDTATFLYLIKWKGWDMMYNTWEPIDHLSGCKHLVENFRLMLRNLSEANKSAFKKLIFLNCMIDELTSSDNQDPMLLLKLNGKTASDYESGDLWSLKRVLKKKFTFKANENQPDLKYYGILTKVLKDLNILQNFETFDKFEEFFKTRKVVFKCLKNWEAKINHSIPTKDGYASIEVENNVDLDPPPLEFKFITKCIPGTPDVHINDKPAWFCKCDDDCNSNHNVCCPKTNESKTAYNKNGCLKNLDIMTIFECNSLCECPPNCSNRVIQKGISKFKLGIFKTDNSRGWGVKALEKIPKGTFVVEYIGEIVTLKESERRSVLGPFYGQYLFNLDYDSEVDCGYLIDGAKYGNISRFINHSCSPNLEVYMFWVDNPDIRMPRVAFFSQRAINKGEELSIDYRMSVVQEPVTNEEDYYNAGLTKLPCKCMSVNCKKFLYC